jgi:hypothetical protein
MGAVMEKQTEERAVSGFDRVAFAAHGSLSITQGDRESLTVTAEGDVLPEIKTEVRDGTLWLEYKSEHWWRTLTRRDVKIEYALTVRELSGLSLSGAGKVTAPGIRTDSLALNVSGAGKLDFGALETGELTLNLSGAGKCVVSGSTRTQTITISGAGKYKAADLDSGEATVLVSGTGSVKLSVRDALTVRISGAGKVGYYGTPKVTEKITGIGSVRNLGDERPQS